MNLEVFFAFYISICKHLQPLKGWAACQRFGCVFNSEDISLLHLLRSFLEHTMMRCREKVEKHVGVLSVTWDIRLILSNFQGLEEMLSKIANDLQLFCFRNMDGGAGDPSAE